MRLIGEGNKMYDRLLDKNIIPTMEEFISHIGFCKDLYRNIELFITNELSA
jgi:hypothetical protein